MCAEPDKATTDEFRSRKGRQRAYKVIYKRTARPSMYTNSGVPYSPGCNVDRNPVKTYLGYARGCQRGFHCLLGRQKAREFQSNCADRRALTVVCVSFDPCDVIAVESSHWGDGLRRDQRQVVVRALHISERAWRQAGLPKRKGRNR